MGELPRSLRIVSVWALIGLALFLGFRTWEAQQAKTRFEFAGGLVEIRRGPDGHYHWPGRVNGRPVEFLIDTGATTTAVPEALARELGLQSLGRVGSQTAAGLVDAGVARIDLELDGGVAVRNLRVVTLAGLGAPLLGMNVLGRMSWRQSDGVLRIDTRPAADADKP